MTIITQTFTGMSLRTKAEIGAAVLVVVGVTIWGLTRTPAPVPEDTKPAPAVLQSDGSQVVARDYTPKPTPPKHVIPHGYVEERREVVHVAPEANKKDVEVDLSIVRKDNEVRVVASSPDGTITYAQDSIIVPQLTPAPSRPWAAGLAYSSEREVGVWVERDIGRLRLGAEVSKGAGRPRAELRVGVAF